MVAVLHGGQAGGVKSGAVTAPIHNAGGAINLQATLSASSAGAGVDCRPHHPITCTGELAFHEDGRFACEHGAVPPGDERTVYCLQHSIALLLIEVAVATLGA
jgi:hypothetical protein